MIASDPNVDKALKIFLRVVCVLLAVPFLAAWAFGHLIMAYGGFMGTAMMNDSGKMAVGLQELMMCGVLFSQLLTGLAGIPASLAFFWWSRSLLCLKIAGALFGVGVALLIGQLFLVWLILGND